MQHYEGITLTGNTVLMLASAMKLKGCPTICDEDLRRVEQTYPNQFSRLPDELLLSSGWRRISKYCHFSGKPIPDGVPFFHSRDRCHPNGGYYFLLAASIGMERPSDVEPLSMDMLIVLQTDFPTQCDQTPNKLIEDPSQWTLVTRFCFFSGGPINSDEDVYYKADFNGNFIFMLAFLSPNMTPEELYRLNDITGENALKSVAAVEEIETVYDLTERDFDDLKMYHLGPCRALSQHLLTQNAWEKVLPQHFLQCRENALARAFEYEVHAQEAIAKAGKLVGLGLSRENSYESISNHPTPYKSKIVGNTVLAPDAQYGHLPRDTTDNERQEDAPQNQEVGSYVEMRQISEAQGQFDGSFNNSGEGGNMDIDQAQEEKEEPGPINDASPEPISVAGKNQINAQYSEDPTDFCVMEDDSTVDGNVNDNDDPTINFTPATERNAVNVISQIEDPPFDEKDDLIGMISLDEDDDLIDEVAQDVVPVLVERARPNVTDLIKGTTTKELTIGAIDDDPTMADGLRLVKNKLRDSNIVGVGDPNGRVNDSVDRALESYYKGIGQHEHEVSFEPFLRIVFNVWS